MSLRTIRTEGVELATQAFGDPTNLPVLLIMGGPSATFEAPYTECRLRK